LLTFTTVNVHTDPVRNCHVRQGFASLCSAWPKRGTRCRSREGAHVTSIKDWGDFFETRDPNDVLSTNHSPTAFFVILLRCLTSNGAGHPWIPEAGPRSLDARIDVRSSRALGRFGYRRDPLFAESRQGSDHLRSRRAPVVLLADGGGLARSRLRESPP
jgi:hypothetical protein